MIVQPRYIAHLVVSNLVVVVWEWTNIGMSVLSENYRKISLGAETGRHASPADVVIHVTQSHPTINEQFDTWLRNADCLSARHPQKPLRVQCGSRQRGSDCG